VSRKKKRKDKVVVRVPNPDAPVRERLKTPSHKVHRSKKAYRRRPKHAGRDVD
jgi:hypothetical protein